MFDLMPAAGRGRRPPLDLADHLETVRLPLAPEADGVGRDRYAVESRFFAGTNLDLDEVCA